MGGGGSLASTLYLFFCENVPLDRAMEHLSFKYGHVRQGKTGVIDAAFETYLGQARRVGADLRDVDAFFEWVDGDYDPVAIKKAFRPTLSGAVLTDLILRRE